MGDLRDVGAQLRIVWRERVRLCLKSWIGQRSLSSEERVGRRDVSPGISFHLWVSVNGNESSWGGVLDR